eukprot:SAG11_NODE_386_length_9887_cov_3.904986_8_plen_126_part_00
MGGAIERSTELKPLLPRERELTREPEPEPLPSQLVVEPGLEPEVAADTEPSDSEAGDEILFGGVESEDEIMFGSEAMDQENSTQSGRDMLEQYCTAISQQGKSHLRCFVVSLTDRRPSHVFFCDV